MMMEIISGVAVLLFAAGIVALFKMSATCVQLQTWQYNHDKVEDRNRDDLTTRLDRMDQKLDRESLLAGALNNLADAVNAIHQYKAEQRRG